MVKALSRLEIQRGWDLALKEVRSVSWNLDWGLTSRLKKTEGKAFIPRRGKGMCRDTGGGKKAKEITVTRCVLS